jgi:putative ABC transport system permease protein
MDRGGNSLRIFGRLKPGVSLAQAQAEISTITARLERQYPGSNRNVMVVPLKEKVVGQVRPALLVLLGAVGFVLLIACANVAHMLLARTAARQKEIAVRASLGATRSRVVQQLLTECVLLSMVGGIVGFGLAWWGVRVLVALGGADIPRSETIGVDAHVMVFALLTSLLTGIAFGLIPALRTSKLNVSESLKEGDRGSSEGIRRNRFRSLLVASEFALALMLLTGAGLMIRSFSALQDIDPGFNPHNVLSMVVSVAGSKQAEPNRRAAFYQEVIQRINGLPGVQSASAINHLPLAGDTWGFQFYAEERPLPRQGESPTATYRVVLPKYFQTMNIPLLRGRDIQRTDDLHSPGVVVVNDWLAHHYWPGQDAIGKRITLDDPRQTPTWLTVVGVVKNTVRAQWSAPPEEEIFLPYLQTPSYLEGQSFATAYLTLVVRSNGNPADLAATVQAEIRALDKNVPISEVQTMDRVVTEATAQSRFYLFLLGAFAAVALLLAAVGIYGVVSYSVSRRTHEIGIRMALGANTNDVVKMVISQALTLVVAGVAAGAAGALTLSRLLSGMLYGVKPSDPSTFFAVSLLLTMVALVATYIPARRAARVDPVVALRYE